MDFDVTDVQEQLVAGVRATCERRFGLEDVRAVERTGRLDTGRWADLGGLGVFGLRLPEDEGGTGLAMVDAAVVFQELGRHLVPGPLVGTHLAAGTVKGADDGTAIVGLVERTATTVEHLASLDLLLVLDDDGVAAVDPADLRATPVGRPLDPLTPLHQVGVLPAGDRIAGPDVADRWRLEGTVLTAALLAGIADAAVAGAVAYAKERHQFGRAIGSFQAVKHLCADALAGAEVARAAVDAAAATLDHPEVGDVERAVGAAKVLAGEAAVHNAEVSVQVHGGMGFTWELPVHLLLKRAWMLDGAFGGSERHAEAVAGRAFGPG